MKQIFLSSARKLAEKAVNESQPNAAMNFAQAALNLAHAYAVLEGMRIEAQKKGRFDDGFDDEQLGLLKAERDRLMVLATKHCPRDHPDFEEICAMAPEA